MNEGTVSITETALAASLAKTSLLAASVPAGEVIINPFAF
jgi:hypothetical protein